jgi:hypothetical protein
MNEHGDIYRVEEDEQPHMGQREQANPYTADGSPYAPAPRYSVRCVRCGYDLVGLTVGSYCPECGQQVGLGGGVDAQTSGFAIASLVMGILSLVSCSFYGVPALVFGPLAIWFAAKAKAQVQRGESSASSLGLAKAGKVTGIIGLSLFGAVAVLFVVLMLFVGYGIGGFP